MNEFFLVLVIAGLAAFLTFLGALLAERFQVPQHIISGALQFAAGILTAIVGFSLMPLAVLNGPPIPVAVAFLVGGATFVFFEYYSAQRAASQAHQDTPSTSYGLYVGILVDLVIDGVVIGVGSTLTLGTGILLALGLAVSTMPLAFVTIATAKQRGMALQQRRLLSLLIFGCVMAGAVLGYLLLSNQSNQVRLTMIALASGFLITTVTQSLIPEANRKGEPSLAGVLFVAGLALYGFFTLYVR